MMDLERVKVFTIKWKITVIYITVAVTVSAVLDVVSVARGW